jgi:hypothetical protein
MIKRFLINWVTKHLFCAVNLEDVLTIVQDTKGQTRRLLLGKEQISQNEWRVLSEEAKFLESSRMYRIMFATLEKQAQLRMFEQSKCDSDILFGKATLYTLDLQKKLLEGLKAYRPD